ncbi:MAG: glycosyltransferase, partial [Candidatus Nanohaloarchaea archaeon]|nr:glycosyltransferase [Candidatus Nanohaloarchaea archaeon]
MNITVVLTTLNEEEHIEAFLESLFGQTREPDQVVLVDGHSDDATVDKAREYDVDIYFDDGDLASARNLGIDRAEGDVVFTDVDGYVEDDWLEEIEQGFETYPDAVGIQGRSLNTASETLNKNAEQREEGREVRFTHGANMAFRKEVLKTVGGFDSNNSCGWEDMDLGYRVSQHG